MLAQVAALAADPAELLCVWNYRTLYKNTSAAQTSANVSYSEVNAYYFFSDNSFVKTGWNTPFDDVLKMKSHSPKRWLTVDNNLILLDKNGKQETSFVVKENQAVENLLRGEKEITQVVTTSVETVSSPYNDVLAFFPK
jgi:hypothetical protein